MLKIILSIITISGFVTGFSQEQTNLTKPKNKRQHRFVVHATGLYNFDLDADWEMYIYTNPSNMPVARTRHVNNTFGYQAGISYEYRNRKMITFSPGILYGLQKISYDNLYTDDHINPVYEFPRQTALFKTRLSSRYLAPSFALGYDYKVPKRRNLTFQGKLGLSFLFPLDDLNDDLRMLVTYRKGVDTFGSLPIAYSSIFRMNFSSFYSGYLGLTYKMHRSFIKDIRAGITFIHAFGFFTGEDFIGTASHQYVDYKVQEKDYLVRVENYYDRFRNVGLTFAVGF